MNPDVFDSLKIIDDWLDDMVAPAYHEQPLAQDWARISKVGEELGEAIQAFIGVTGQNPRKGIHGEFDDVLGELADTAITALLAMEHFTKDKVQTMQLFRDRLSRILVRTVGREISHESHS